MDDTGNVACGSIAAESRQTLESIRATLEKYGSSLDQVIKVTAVLANMAEWSEIDRVYVTSFETHLSARSAFGTTRLALGTRVEIECIATLD